MEAGTVAHKKRVLTERSFGFAVMLIAGVLVILTHVAYWTLDHEHYAVDTASYLIPTDNLAHGLGFVNELHKPELRRTPGYPLVLALFRIGPLRMEYLIVAQHALCVFVTAAVGFVGWRMSCSKMVALVAFHWIWRRFGLRIC